MNVTGTHDKEYPIHSALKSSSARCVKEIVKMYPKQLHTQVGPTVSIGAAVLLAWAPSRINSSASILMSLQGDSGGLTVGLG